MAELKPEKLKPGIYRHFKGKQYLVIGEAAHSENLESMVVYRALYGDFGLWVRPKTMFCECLVIDGREVPRFALELITD